MSVRRALAWSYGAQAFIFAQSFVVSVIVARILGPYQMGVYAVGAATVGAIAVLSSFGVASYVVRHANPDATVRATAFTVNTALNVFVSLAIAVVVAAGTSWGMAKEVREVLTLLAITPLIGIVEFLPGTFMQRDMRFKTISLVSMCRSLVNTGIMLPAAWAGWGASSLAIAALGSTLFQAVVYNVIARSHVSFRLGLAGWRDMTKFGLQMMSIGGLASLTARATELLLGHFLGLAALGVYNRASSLVGQIWENVYGLSTRVVFAQMAKEMRETGTLRVTYLHGLALITALLGPVFAGLAVLSPALIHFLYGDKWAAAAAPMSILMLAYCVALCFGMNWELCVLRHRTGWQARIEGIRSVVGLAAFAVGASFNVAGAAAGRFVDVVCGLILFGPRMSEMAGAHEGELLRILRQSAALTGVAVAPLSVVMLSSGWSPLTSWAQLLPALAAGAALWLGGAWWLRHPVRTEALRAGQALMRAVARPVPR